MAYTRINWKDYPKRDTPLSAENLNIMDEGIATNTNNIRANTRNIAELANSALHYDTLFQGTNQTGELSLNVDVRDYKFLLIKGWIQKNQENNLAFSYLCPTNILSQGGYLSFNDYDETIGGDNNWYGTITSVVISAANNNTLLFGNRYMVNGDYSQGLGIGKGRWLHSITTQPESRSINIQEVYGLK